MLSCMKRRQCIVQFVNEKKLWIAGFVRKCLLVTISIARGRPRHLHLRLFASFNKALLPMLVILTEQEFVEKRTLLRAARRPLIIRVSLVCFLRKLVSIRCLDSKALIETSCHMCGEDLSSYLHVSQWACSFVFLRCAAQPIVFFSALQKLC